MPTDWFEALRAATAGLTLQSETDAPLRPLRWPVKQPVGVAGLRAYLGLPASIPITARPAAEFLASSAAVKDWFGPEERAIAERYQALIALLSGLTDPTALRVGLAPDFAVYVVGADPDGGWAGFATHVTET